MFRSRDSRCVRIVVAAAAVSVFVLGCGTSAPPPGPVAAAGAAEGGTPLAEIETRLAMMEPLIETAAKGGDEGAPAQRELERLAREAASLSSKPDFATRPLSRGEFRATVLFVARGTSEERLAALRRCRELVLTFRS